MKKFLKRIIYISIMWGILLVALIEGMECLVDQKSDFKIAENKKYVVFGHSHPEAAFNDSILREFKNFGSSGESYFYTYFKAKKIIEQNPAIEVVFLEFTNNQIADSMDLWIWGDRDLSARYPLYSPFMTVTDKLILAKGNPRGFVNCNSLALRSHIDWVMHENYSFVNRNGGYVKIDRNKVDSLIQVATDIATHKSFDISSSNIEYLNKIINLCDVNGKRLILIRSPQHSAYHGYINKIRYQEILKERFAEIEYLDFSRFPLTNDEFGDLEHLNYKGAKRFSIWFSELIEAGLLDLDNKQDFIDENIAAETQN